MVKVDIDNDYIICNDNKLAVLDPIYFSGFKGNKIGPNVVLEEYNSSEDCINENDMDSLMDLDEIHNDSIMHNHFCLRRRKYEKR